MRRLWFALLVCAAAALAANVNGDWSGEGVANGDKQPVYLVLRQDGSTLTGSGGPSLLQQDLIQNGKIDGNKITFDVNPVSATPLHFELTADAGSLKGTITLQHKGQPLKVAISLTRAKT